MLNKLIYYFLFILSILVIGVYGRYRCTHTDFKDPLETQLFYELDGWSVSHYIFYALIGFLYPDQFFLTLILGICWELFEHYYGTQRPGWLGGYGDCPALASDKTTDGNWWYGKWTDIICNILGFLTGQYIREGSIFV